MVSFLFWNLNRLPRQDVVGRLAQLHEVDVIILAECAVANAEMLAALLDETGKEFRQPWSKPGKIRIFTHYPENALYSVFDDFSGRLTIRRLIVGKQDMLLAALHFQSKVNWSDDDQREEMRNIAREIIKIEDDRGHRRTVLVGDFNMNPFEPGVVSSHSLHGVMTRKIAAKRSRTIAGKEYPFFYNPMWSFFGDGSTGPPGTHHYRAAKPIVYFWNIYDQVLIRPDLLDAYNGDLKILDSDGVNSLLTNSGLPSKKSGSDHLPILFRLDI